MQREHPPTLDYQPVTKSRKRIPTWFVVFLVGFIVGVFFPLVTWVSDYPGLMTVSHLEFFAVSLALLANGLWDGLLALLGYAVYRGLRRLCGGSVA